MPFDVLSGNSLNYTEDLYKTFLKDPLQVEDSWRWFFQGLNQGINPQALEKELKVFQFLLSYRDHGSLKAKLNPLESPLNQGFLGKENFGITASDLEKSFKVSEMLFSMSSPLKDVISFLESKYCQTLALEVSGCHPKVKKWFYEEFEKKDFSLSAEDELRAFEQLLGADSFEKNVQFYFLGQKRFSLEGLDSLVPMLDYLLQKGTAYEMKDLILGMSHRGRLNVLVNILKQNPSVLFAGFRGKFNNSFFDENSMTWDVKYHLGFSSRRKTPRGDCDLYLGYNPSHLEAIGPVICGVTRAVQRKNKDMERRKTAVPVLIHGDASFCGQGVVSETLQLSHLKAYTVGGTIHIILNNQLGFTTLPSEGRSSLFASDLAKSIKAPVLLVNADDVFSCLKAMDMAMRFRYEFGLDIFIDLIGYRKYGHNEGDEPEFTQPLMYKKIKKHPCVVKKYQELLIEKKLLNSSKAEQMSKEKNQFFEKALEESKVKEFSKKDYFGLEIIKADKKLKETKITKERLEELLKVLSEIPESFNPHPKLKKILSKRKQNIENNKLDWAMCELLAYGALIQDGFSIRLTGQDSKRGTFSHRHAVYYDYENNETLNPLKVYGKTKNQECCIYNSSLSEMAVLAFEYGNSCLAPDFLTLWEAQFGDFVNGAQIIIDQFISSGESKWLQKTDLILLLPHAYEGQGPEHSSAYLERFLQMCSHNNMRVCQFIKASNLFHAIRRQKQLERKPLILMTPKSLLRHPSVRVEKEELTKGKFEPVIWDKDISDPKTVESLILCSGKVYFEIKKVLEQDSIKRKKTALFCLEQLYPFPDSDLNPVLNGFPFLSKVIWFQEEPKNRGAWFFVRNQLEELLEKLGQKLDLIYAGRSEMAVTAEGTEQAHRKVQNQILSDCLSRL
ncbi:MAG: 2-oxoglutarate dehydrogenase E1 component [Bdellovibrionales bacterium]|nr:2-oxoglutarate dehydrogenase E1 component [Bdellovibrionales bacterium]